MKILTTLKKFDENSLGYVIPNEYLSKCKSYFKNKIINDDFECINRTETFKNAGLDLNAKEFLLIEENDYGYHFAHEDEMEDNFVFTKKEFAHTYMKNYDTISLQHIIDREYKLETTYDLTDRWLWLFTLEEVNNFYNSLTGKSKQYFYKHFVENFKEYENILFVELV